MISGPRCAVQQPRPAGYDDHGKDGAGAMEMERRKRVLAVHRSEGVTVSEAEALTRRGYEVEMCSGPAYSSCPVLRGEPCPAVERADVVVYDAWATTESESSRRLIEGLRDLHPDTPVVVTVPGILLSWIETEGPHGVTPLVGVPSGDRLEKAIHEALHRDREALAVTG